MAQFRYRKFKSGCQWLTLVSHLTIQEAKLRRIHLSRQNVGVIVCACYPVKMGLEYRSDLVQASLEENTDSISKTTRAKWAGDIVQVIELMPRKAQSLKANPQYQEKKKSKFYSGRTLF
jgi:hypothetical protein